MAGAPKRLVRKNDTYSSDEDDRVELEQVKPAPWPGHEPDDTPLERGAHLGRPSGGP